MQTGAGPPLKPANAASQPLTVADTGLRLLALRRRDVPLFSGTVLVLFILAGLFGPLIAPHDATQVDLARTLLPPAFLAGGNWSYPLGTDDLGRDVLSRLLGGSRISLLVAVSVVLLSGGFGVALGAIAGYLGGRIDTLLMRVTDAALAFPFLLLAIVIAGIFGAGTRNVIIILALAGWASYARVIRSEVLKLKNEDYVTMAVVMGAGPVWVIRSHVIPNIVSSFLVLATLQLGHAIVAEASLSFLGIGVPPPAPSWGGMLSDGRRFMTAAWWLPTLPGLALSLTVLSSNLMGDWMRNRNDPTGRH